MSFSAALYCRCWWNQTWKCHQQTTKLAQCIWFNIPHQNRTLKSLSRPDTWGLDTATPSSRFSSTMVAAFYNQNYAANQGKSYLSSENNNQYFFKPLTVSNLHPHYFLAFSIAYFSFELGKNTPFPGNRYEQHIHTWSTVSLHTFYQSTTGWHNLWVYLWTREILKSYR